MQMSYKLYTDKQEVFECKIHLEGASLTKANSRIIVETQDLSPIKNDIVAMQTSIAGINSSIDSMYDDVRSLKNMNDNPLAN